MVSKELLLENFEVLTGCNNVSDEVLEKCVELCHWYGINEDEFGDMWVPFCIQHQNGNSDLTLKALEEFKRTIPREEKDCDSSFKKHQEENEKLVNISKPSRLTDNERDILKVYATPENLSKLNLSKPTFLIHQDETQGQKLQAGAYVVPLVNENRRPYVHPRRDLFNTRERGNDLRT